jgi:hypothetical protein
MKRPGTHCTGGFPGLIMIGAESPPARDSILGLYSPWHVAIPIAVFHPRPNDGCIKLATDIHINSYVYFGGSF